MRSKKGLISYRFVLLLALSALSAGGRPTPFLPSGKDRWIQVQTANFTLFSDASESRTVELGTKLEQLRGVLAKIHPGLSVHSPKATYVFVFKDAASFAPYKKRIDGKPANIDGWFISGRDASWVAMNGSALHDPLHTIYHEYIHDFMNANFPSGVPTWFSEGIADCYGTFRADEKTAEIGRPARDRVEFLSQHSLIPLQELFAIDTRSKDYNEGERQGIFYAESWALVHYVFWDKPERLPQLVRFLDRLDQGHDIAELFEECFQTTLARFEAEFRSFVSSGRFLFEVVKVGDLTFDKSVQVRPMPREDLLSRLGDYLVHVDPDRAGDAEVLVQEALRTNPSHASAHATLAYLRDLAGRHDEATSEYEKSIGFDPDDFMIQFHYGHALLLQEAGRGPEGKDRENVEGRLEKIRVLLGRSIALRPDFAEAYVDFGLTFLLSDHGFSAGITALEKARAMLPSRTGIVVNLVTLYALNGDGAKAQSLIDTVLAHAHDPEALRSAREALGTVMLWGRLSQPTSSKEGRGDAPSPETVPQPDGGERPDATSEPPAPGPAKV